MNSPNEKKVCSKILSKLVLFSSIVFASSASAAIPAGYYDTADQTNATTLRNSLHAIIDDHQRFPYTSTSTDTWDILETADQDPDVPGNVITIYRNASYAKQGGGNTFYNREHSWPKSYGFPNDGSTNYPYTDTHHLFIADSGYNSSRSNKPYANCSGCNEKLTEFNNNRGGVDSNWTAGSFTAGSWETWNARKGDVARAMFYMAVRYEGGTHGVTGVSEPDLILTDDRALIDASNTGSNGSVAYMGLRSTLIQWHKDDPVDDFERRHTDTVYSHQGNRNPFIDHPEYVVCVFESVCSGGGGGGGDVTPPAAPTGLGATAGSGLVDLSWFVNSEPDVAGYNVYRSTTTGGTYAKINTSLITGNTYSDTGLTGGVTYYYVISAVDTSVNESSTSSEASATPTEPPVQNNVAWINEFHYDNASTDVGEFVEIAGTANTNLSGWSIVGYNGNGGTVYKTTNLSGVIADQSSGFGMISFAISGIQNGAPDGLALVDNTGVVIQFLSYEGTLTAVDGPAASMTSTDVGVAETGSTLVGDSLQLGGSGQAYADFTWQAASANTSGLVNNGQSFSGTPPPPPANQDPVASFSYSCTGLTCSFDASASSDADGTITNYDWAYGDGNLDVGVNPSYSYIAAGSYTVVLTVIDDAGATAQNSMVVSVSEIVSEPSFFENNTVTPIPDRGTITSNIDVNRSGAAGTVTVAVNITHTYRGDIEIVLSAPDGSSYTLKTKNGGDGANDIVASYTVNVSGNAQGTWVLEVSDKFKSDTGQLNSWSVQF